MKIKKTITAKHEASLSSFIRNFTATATSLPVTELLPFLAKFPRNWPFPRGDLYHWIQLLNRFDTILEEQVDKYKFKDGPQTIPWEQEDRELVIGIVDFTRLLVENCGNRSIYASSALLGELLNTTDIDVLQSTLGLTLRLAQRYHTSRTRGGSNAAQSALLASHYNINLGKVVTVASPFLKSMTTANSSSRDKTSRTVLPVYASDLGQIARGENPVDIAANQSPQKGKGKAEESKEGSWEDWGGAWISYYVNPKTQSPPSAPGPFVPREPTTPTPARRSSLHQSHTHSHSHSHSGPAQTSRAPVDNEPEAPDASVTGGLQTLEVPYSRIRDSTNLEEILKSTLPDIPTDSHYDFLHRLRVASALAGDVNSRRKILAVRILALTNLAYIFNDNQFIQKILTLDSDEPRRLQLAYQLGELVQGGETPGKGTEIPKWLQTLALGALEALARHKARAADVCTALGVNVSHGVLLYLMRKVVVDLSKEGEEDDKLETEDWRDALFSLVTILPTTSNTGPLLVSAGLIPILVDLINLRTNKAYRHISKGLSLLDTLHYSVQNTFQTFANSKGLEAVVNLASDEVHAGLEEIKNGNGIPEEYRNETMDYKISYQRHQTLRMVTKFMAHMMAQQGHGVDRLLRNLVDNPKLLEAIKLIIAQSHIWGSNIWSTVVGMISAFIHNEPTSYAVIHEAHITHTFLEAITGKTGLVEQEARRKKEEEAGVNADVQVGPSPPLEQSTLVVQPAVEPETTNTASMAAEKPFPPQCPGIMPNPDAIGCIPTAFGAFCLNPLGLELIQASGALVSFFDIFESPAHCKILIEGELDNLLGTQFDELARHHPNLRETILTSTINLIDRVIEVGHMYAEKYGMGAKIWLENGNGEVVVSGGWKALAGRPRNTSTSGSNSSSDKTNEENRVARMGDVKYDEPTSDNKFLSICDYIDVTSRLLEGFLTNTTQTAEVLRRGGLDKLLEFFFLPSLPFNFASTQASATLCRAVNLFCESNLGETLNAVFMSSKRAIATLGPILNHEGSEPFFGPLTSPTSALAADEKVTDVRVDGTTIIKDLVSMHSLCYLLQDLYAQTMFNTRSSIQVFIQTVYQSDETGLIDMLGALQRQCIWEEIQLQNSIPHDWDEVTRSKDSATSTAIVIEEAAAPNVSGSSEHKDVPLTTEQKKEAEKAIVEKDGNKPWFRNVKTIRFLIGVLPSSINPFLHGLSKALISRRSSDLVHKYNAFKIVDRIACAMVKHLQWEKTSTSESTTEKYGYWIIMLSSITNLLLEGASSELQFFDSPKSTPPDRQPLAITCCLVAFKQQNGLQYITKILKTFWSELQNLPATDDKELSIDDQQRMTHAFAGIRIILSLFSYLVTERAITHSVQSDALHMRNYSEWKKPDFFSTQQLLVELKATILPVMQEMWEDSMMEKKETAPIVKAVVEILSIILKKSPESENSAFKRSVLEERPGLNNILSWQAMKPRDELIKRLTDKGFTAEEARDALLRCNDHVDNAENLLRTQRGDSATRGLISTTVISTNVPLQADNGEDDGDATEDDSATGQYSSVPSTQSTVDTAVQATDPTAAVPALVSDAMDIDEPPTDSSKGKAKEVVPESPVIPEKVITVEDLDELRAGVRDNLVSRSLDVLQVQEDITFELGDLLRASYHDSSPDSRREVVSTIVLSLLSLMDDDIRPKAKSIGSTAHMLGLILQSQQFYNAAIEDLNEQLPVLIGFIKIYPGSRAPWIPSILLIVEKLLAENAQPTKITFTVGQTAEESVVESTGVKVSEEDQEALFDALVSILPDIDKEDHMLALSVIRIFILLTRRRQLATKMVDGGTLRNIFHMYRRQAGNNVERLQPAILLMLRHIIEDDDTLRAIMKAEIRAQFSARVPGRQLDTTTFTKNCSHLILRNPDIFIEVVSEICKLSSYNPHLRHQGIQLKDLDKPKTKDQTTSTTETTDKTTSTEAEAESTKTETKVEESKDEEKETTEKAKTHVETKVPGVENPDGVIHFLLMELFAIKDVKDVVPPAKEAPKVEEQPVPKDDGLDTPMTDVATAAASTATTTTAATAVATTESKPAESGKSEKVEFKAEQHPYFFYRCFILMTLMELLCSYNRCKVEFINFNRKANPREPITPSKPRSAIFNYLLHDLISQHSLTTTHDIEQATKEKLGQWAIHIFISLCTESGEVSPNEDEPDLLFVRKFFFETALKSFRDACASQEPLDVKYARMASHGDLFYKVITTRPPCASVTNSHPDKAQQDLAKIMLEKNYISALTGALSEVDINFPNARKVIKAILKPLKHLSKTAVELGEIAGFPAPGTADEDDISVAESMSSIEDDDMREETPDLYRNSTLGLFEEIGEEQSDDYDEDDGDEEMYDEEMYDDEDTEQDPGSDESSDDDEEDVDNPDMDIAMGDEDEVDSDDDSDSDDMDEDMDDEMAEVEIIDETAEHHHHHHHDEYESAGDDAWPSQDSGDDDEDEDEEEEEMMGDDNLNTIARALGVEDDVEGIDDRDDIYPNDEGDEDDDIEGEDDDDDLDDEEQIISEDYDDEDEGASGNPWGWAEGDEAPIVTRTQTSRGTGGWFTLSGAPRDPPVFAVRPTVRPRHYMGTAAERGPPSNREINPLLQQADNEPVNVHRNGRHEFIGDLTNAAFGGMGMPIGEGHPATSMINTLMNLMNRGGMPAGQWRIEATIPQRSFPHGMRRDLHSMFGHAHPFRISAETSRPREDPSQFGRFDPSSTSIRWMEEARLLFGSRVDENAQRVINTIMARLVPAALEAEKIKKAQEELEKKEKQRIEEERKKKEEEERLAKEKAEAEERARKEAEEKEAAERAKAEEEARAAETAANAPEGAQPAEESSAAAEEVPTVPNTPVDAGPAEPVQRVTIMIRGREMDITGMGIDPDFLEAIPEDMREEALAAHVRERRAAAAVTNEAPSEISAEFLDALPDDIREELLAQEAADRRRREQQSTARNAPGGGPADIDLATFLATLEPGLRQTVLMEQDDEHLAHLPPGLVEEANALRVDRGFNNPFAEAASRSRLVARQHPHNHAHSDEQKKKPVRKGTIQLLDKAGIATLLRLMFIPQVGTTRSSLLDILVAVCENRQNRIEVLGLLLSILQDGSADMVAVERIYSQLSARARQTPAQLQKTPSKPTPQRQNTGPITLAQTSGEVTPLMVAQQCLECLMYLVGYNEHIPFYFLNEHDNNSGLKKSASRKGKGKQVETKASKFALNTLLSLLDRSLITESSTVMDRLSNLLSEITRPLALLHKKDKKKTETETKKDEPAAVPAIEGAPAAEATAEGEATKDKEEPKDDKAKEDGKKKSRQPPSPPYVPEHNLRLVVNILTAQECSSKTFRETLATMQNLSGIPGSKDVFGGELIRQAQGLGAIILGHLAELEQQINNAGNGTEVQGLALAHFSSASSEQSKLLRILTALDYLFDPKRGKDKDDKKDDKKDKKEIKADDKKEDEATDESADMLPKLYESLAFGSLWAKLSDCLLAIHKRSDMLHVATILLPLMEALMVVCKNGGLEEETTKANEAAPMRQLFFKFTEDHRKILNQMVRNNPKLMSGTFALLVRNPMVLDFDNKRNYFTRKLHNRNSARETHPTLQLNIRREHVFMDSYKAMYFKRGDEIKYAKLSVRFHGEEGVDAGGVTREWFQVISKQIFNPNYALFAPVAGDKTTFHPDQRSSINSEHLSFFKFTGHVIGKALYEGRVMDCHFSRAVYKRILGKPVSLKDMETLDLEYYKSLVWMLENDIDDIITETFSVEVDEFGATKIIDLIPDGRNIPVTNQNKQDYVRRIVDHKLLHSISSQIEAFLEGFHEIIPAELISIFNVQELELLISGMPDIDIDDWRNNTEYHNYSASSSQIQWFWRAVRSFDKEERAKLLQFATGTSKVPLNGFKELEGMNGFSKFNIHRDYGNKERLPSSHTCFNQLDLPEYETYETLRKQLLTAITQGAEYFGFA